MPADSKGTAVATSTDAPPILASHVVGNDKDVEKGTPFAIARIEETEAAAMR